MNRAPMNLNGMSGRSNRTAYLMIFLAALLLAGVLSFYASSHPDGLMYVAESTGFVDTARDTAAGNGPLAGYDVRGVDSARLSGGLAGVIGVLVTVVVAGGGALLLRRRSRDA